MPVDAPEDLYGLPLEQFTKERAALAKALRARKQGEEAKRVAGLRKPTVAAWAVNQLVRTQAKAIKALFAAGDDLNEAQAGGRPAAEQLREATRRQRAALDELLGSAEGLLSGEGHGLAVTTLERVRETLRAAAIDPAARSQVESGCLTREFQAAGLLGLTVATASSSVSSAKQPKPEDDKRRRAAQKAAQKAEQQATKQAEQALRRLEQARERHQQAGDALEQAKAAVNEAQEELDQAEREAKQAADQLSDAGGR